MLLREPKTLFEMENRKKRSRLDDEDYVANKRLISEAITHLHLESTNENDTPNNEMLFEKNADSNSYCTDTMSINDYKEFNEVMKAKYLDDLSSSEDEMCEYDEDQETFIPVLKGGKTKYLRKVDYLVDELIRKSHRTSLAMNGDHQTIGYLPASIGPQPNVDQALTKAWPLRIFGNNSILFNDGTGPKRMVLDNPTVINNITTVGTGAVCSDDETYVTTLPSKKKLASIIPSRAGVLTHTDWEMEELQGDTSGNDRSEDSVNSNLTVNSDNRGDSQSMSSFSSRASLSSDIVQVDTDGNSSMRVETHSATSLPAASSHLNAVGTENFQFDGSASQINIFPSDFTCYASTSPPTQSSFRFQHSFGSQRIPVIGNNGSSTSTSVDGSQQNSQQNSRFSDNMSSLTNFGMPDQANLNTISDVSIKDSQPKQVPVVYSFN